MSTLKKRPPANSWSALLALWLGTLALGGSQSASVRAQDLTGSVILPPVLQVDNLAKHCAPSECYWNEANGVLPTRAYHRDPQQELSVVLVAKTATDKPEPRTVELSGGGFAPSTIVVAPRTVVHFRNTDVFTREPYSTDSSLFTPRVIAPQGTHSVKINKVGHWALADHRIPSALAHIHAVSGVSAWGRVSSDGGFRFGDIESGSYTLQIYYQSSKLAEQRVIVGAKGTTKIEPISLNLP